jgi:F-type H+-transporting ATPase subunit gamma
MARVQSLRQRIKSVKNIRQITKAMEMVAASKLRRAQEGTLRSRSYAHSAREALARLRLHVAPEQHPLFAERPVKNQLIILFTSDRGLAGAYNSNVFKALGKLLADTNPVTRCDLMVIGQKGASFAARIKDKITLIGSYIDWPAHPTTLDIRPIAKTALEGFIKGRFDRVTLIYTDFISLLRQSVTAWDLLPIDPARILPKEEADEASGDILFEPSPQEVANFIIPRLVEVQLYQASLEAAASEQSMRMMAMRSASDNATEVIGDLTLTYNGARQAAITQELAEISAGAQAIQ